MTIYILKTNTMFEEPFVYFTAKRTQTIMYIHRAQFTQTHINFVGRATIQSLNAYFPIKLHTYLKICRILNSEKQ